MKDKLTMLEKVELGNDHKMVQSESSSHSKNQGVGKSKLTISYLSQGTDRKPSEQLFPNRHFSLLSVTAAGACGYV